MLDEAESIEKNVESFLRNHFGCACEGAFTCTPGVISRLRLLVWFRCRGGIFCSEASGIGAGRATDGLITSMRLRVGKHVVVVGIARHFGLGAEGVLARFRVVCLGKLFILI